jgi:hypothetical protein
MVAGPSADVNFETIIAQLAKFANSHLQAKLLLGDFSAAAAPSAALALSLQQTGSDRANWLQGRCRY